MRPDYVYLTFAALCLAFSYPAATQGAGRVLFLKTFLFALIRFTLGVFVPFVYFFLSMAVSPDWKGAAETPFACINETKVWLTPLAVWAWVSFYFFVVLRVTKVRSWMTLGLFTGCLGSILCTLCMFFLRSPFGPRFEWPLVIIFSPLVYLPLWYGYSARRAQRIAPARPYHYCVTMLSQAVGWAWAADRSIDTYNALENSQSCYVVTASANGFPWLVRPSIEVDENGIIIFETLQLKRIRALEALWKDCAPKSHRYFRVVYDLLGPILARSIAHPILASASYLILKPLEAFAAVILRGRKGQ